MSAAFGVWAVGFSVLLPIALGICRRWKQEHGQ